eukprot:COSAG02_NODE_54677_length_294_cov_259.230769_1_plen_32_part_10
MMHVVSLWPPSAPLVETFSEAVNEPTIVTSCG